MKVTMIEIEAGAGYNEGAELRLILQANEVTTVPQAIETFSTDQAEIFGRYDDEPSDYRPILGRHDGFRYTDEWTYSA